MESSACCNFPFPGMWETCCPWLTWQQEVRHFGLQLLSRTWMFNFFTLPVVVLWLLREDILLTVHTHVFSLSMSLEESPVIHMLLIWYSGGNVLSCYNTKNCGCIMCSEIQGSEDTFVEWLVRGKKPGMIIVPSIHYYVGFVLAVYHVH